MKSRNRSAPAARGHTYLDDVNARSTAHWSARAAWKRLSSSCSSGSRVGRSPRPRWQPP